MPKSPAISLPNPTTISWVRGALTFGSTLLVLTSSAGFAGSNPVTDRIRLWLISLACTTWSPLRSVQPRSIRAEPAGLSALESCPPNR